MIGADPPRRKPPQRRAEKRRRNSGTMDSERRYGLSRTSAADAGSGIDRAV